MEDMDKELKMELLQKLMDEMDDGMAKRLPMKKRMEEAMASEDEPMAVVEEKQVMPLDDAQELVEDKLEAASEEPQEDEDDEDYGGSRLMAKIKEARLKKKMMSEEE